MILFHIFIQHNNSVLLSVFFFVCFPIFAFLCWEVSLFQENGEKDWNSVILFRSKSQFKYKLKMVKRSASTFHLNGLLCKKSNSFWIVNKRLGLCHRRYWLQIKSSGAEVTVKHNWPKLPAIYVCNITNVYKYSIQYSINQWKWWRSPCGRFLKKPDIPLVIPSVSCSHPVTMCGHSISASVVSAFLALLLCSFSPDLCRWSIVFLLTNCSRFVKTYPLHWSLRGWVAKTMFDHFSPKMCLQKLQIIVCSRQWVKADLCSNSVLL